MSIYISIQGILKPSRLPLPIVDVNRLVQFAWVAGKVLGFSGGALDVDPECVSDEPWDVNSHPTDAGSWSCEYTCTCSLPMVRNSMVPLSCAKPRRKSSSTATSLLEKCGIKVQ